MTDRSLRAFVMEATVRAGAEPIKPDEIGVPEWLAIVGEVAHRLRSTATIRLHDGRWSATFTYRPSLDRGLGR